MHHVATFGSDISIAINPSINNAGTHPVRVSAGLRLASILDLFNLLKYLFIIPGKKTFALLIKVYAVITNGTTGSTFAFDFRSVVACEKVEMTSPSRSELRNHRSSQLIVLCLINVSGSRPSLCEPRNNAPSVNLNVVIILYN